jgi:hypothetical protein
MVEPTALGSSYQMQLLEPLSWIAQNHAAVGGSVNLSLPELHVHALAQVQAISACPIIESGSGRVVLGTFEHVSNDIVDVNLVGALQSLKVTAGHKLWSLDRDGWVPAADLRAGERLAGENGPVAVESVTADQSCEVVYNLDVETDHRYLVTEFGVVAHNASPCPHLAKWRLRGGNGHFAGHGEETSGVDFALRPGQKLTFPEQSWYGHTEGKIISDLFDAGKLSPGSTLEIEGQLDACTQCKIIMQWASKTFKIKILYESAEGKAWAWINGVLQ